jgi:hypothetical protein
VGNPLPGSFGFRPPLVHLDSDALALGAKLPGSSMIPASHALRPSLALKLWSIERKSHIMALVADEGLALFCGLNAVRFFHIDALSSSVGFKIDFDMAMR